MAEDSITEEKRRLRDKMRAALDSFSDRAPASARIAEHFLSFPPFAGASTVMLYASLPEEVETTRLLEETIKQKKRLVIPWVRGDDLVLCEIRDAGELAHGSFGILEPGAPIREDKKRLVAPAELDLVAVPGLAFDRSGHRLGRGKGFYDRFLTALPSTSRSVALAFSFQVVEALPAEPHDVEVGALITEHGVLQLPSLQSLIEP